MKVEVDAEELAELRLRAKRDRRRERDRERRRNKIGAGLDEADYYRFVTRSVQNAVKRSAEGGITSLEMLSKLSTDIDEVIATLVTFLRSEEGDAHTWSQIGKALGITKARAIQRYGTGEGARKPGGQPANLRRG